MGIPKRGKEMLLLNVSYEEKDEAKRLGVRWNPDLKNGMFPKRKITLSFISGFFRRDI